MKKRIFPLVLALLLTLSGCGTNSEGSLNDYLVTRSVAQSQIAGEMAASELFHELYTLSGEVMEMVADIAEVEYDNPVRAVIVTGADRALLTYMEREGQIASLAEADYHFIENRVFTSLPTMLNAQRGQWMLAATGMLYVERAYQAHKDLTGNTYVCLLYEGEYGTITTFMASEEGTVIATTGVVALPGPAVLAMMEGSLDTHLDAILPVGDIAITYIDL